MTTRKVKCLMTSVLAFLCFLFSTSKSQDYDHCGLRSVSMRTRIIGGIQSRPGMWPWQVAIYKGSDDGMKGKQFICGGALVNTKWVITTAHCFFKISETSSRIRYVDDSSSPNKYHVVVGDYNIFRKEATEQVRQALNIRIFPGYRHSPYYENDIALIELNETVTLGPFVRTICIPDSNEKVSVPGKEASVAGWGRTTKSVRSPVLLHSAYQIQNDDLCDQATAYFFNRSVTFCAGSGKGGNDTCQGDSGSSLVRQVLHKGRQRWVTVGLVSWGEGCGIKGKYGYYTRMEPFVPWIQKTIKVNCGKPRKIRNGRFSGKDFSEGSRVKYKCKIGYKLKGRPRRKCRHNGEWSKAPVCRKAQCPRLSNPSNGSRRPAKRKYFYEDRVRFSCKTNFTRIGKPFIICKHDATWSGSKAFCLAPCPDPGIPKGGSRLDHSFRHNNLVRFSCNRGRKMEGARTIRCNRGRWNQKPPKCLGSCEVPDNFADVHSSPRVLPGQIVQHSNRITFSCLNNKTLNGSKETVCDNGNWMDIFPKCEVSKTDCQDPGVPQNGYVTSLPAVDFPQGTTITFACNYTHTSQGHQTIECQSGNWSHDIPKCLAPCKDPGVPKDGIRYDNAFKHNDRVRFACKTGKTIKGEAVIRCNNGKWNHDTPQCMGTIRTICHSFLPWSDIFCEIK